METNFCITMTTIPNRLSNIYKTINSIEKQTVKPNRIFLNIPNTYYRFPGVKIPESEIEKIKSELVQINRCDDYGPATKIMGALNQVKSYDCVIIIDDDHLYDKRMCEIFIREFEKKKNNYSFYIQKIFSINMAQCADGFLINCENLDKIEKFYDRYVKKNKNMFLDDDLWLSIYLQIIKKTKIENLIEMFNTETGKKLVYEVHSSVDALSDKIHSPKKFLNRRKIAKIEILKFIMKNYFNKLTQL